VHAPKVDPSKSPNPPAGEPSSSVSLEGRRANAGLLLFHRAIRTVEIGEPIDSGIPPYARFTQRACRRGADARDGNRFANTVPTRGFWRILKTCAKRLILLAPRAGFEPATIRLTVECSTAELPRNSANRSATASV
jgi:hypothetical protein